MDFAENLERLMYRALSANIMYVFNSYETEQPLTWRTPADSWCN